MHKKNPNCRIKVLVVNGSLQHGGAEIQMAKLLPQIDRRMFDVQVAYYNHNTGHPLEMLCDANVPVTYLGQRQGWSRTQCFARALSFMKQERFDLVHAWSASANHYARIPAMLAGVPVIIGGLRGKSGMQRVWPYFYSLLNIKCTGWIVNSSAMAEFALSEMKFMKNCPIRVIRNGFDCEKRGVFKTNELTVYDKLTRGLPVIGIVGRLHPVKNHAMFLAMARCLSDQGFEADYWIIGDGPERNTIEQAIQQLGLQEKVRLLGKCDDVDAALSRMDLLVLTSKSESCPNVLLEAMRASLPVVATNCTSLDEIIDEGVNGYVIPIDDVREMADRVKLIFADPDKRHAMGEESRLIVQKRFSLSIASSELEQAYWFFLNKVSKKNLFINAKLDQLGAQ